MYFTSKRDLKQSDLEKLKKADDNNYLIGGALAAPYTATGGKIAQSLLTQRPEAMRALAEALKKQQGAGMGAAIGAEEDIYPNDLLDPEPFIRAPVVSHEGAMVIEEMRREDEWTGAFSNAFVDPAWSLTEWEESDWVRNHPDPMISRIYVQATDRRYNRSKR